MLFNTNRNLAIYASNGKPVWYKLSQTYSLPQSFLVASFTSWIHHTSVIDMEALVKPNKIPAYLHKNKILMYSENIP